MRLLAALTALLLSACASAPALPPLKTVDYVDLDRYMGRWYVIANIPYFLEEGKVASYDTYAKRDDGWMDNNFSFRRETLDAPETTWTGRAKVVNTTSNAEWKVQFIWPFTAKYLVIDLDPAYQWAVVGYPDRSLMWVLARNTTLDEGIYQGILQRAAAQGYNPAQVAKVLQPQAATIPAK